MKKNIIIRQTAQTDFAPIYDLIKTAFQTAEHSDGDEQEFAKNLRKGENYIPQLDLVAEIDGRRAGHIMLTKTTVTKPDGSTYDTLMIAPLSVLLEYRCTGVGSALMQEGLRIAGTMGYGAAFLLGDPAYYQRFGFMPIESFGIGHEVYPLEYMQVKEIVPEALKDITGKINM